MNKIKKALLLAMSLVMTACVAVGCGSQKDSADSTPPTSSEAPASSEAPDVSEEASEETSEEESVVSKEKYNVTLVDGHPMFPAFTKTIKVEEGADLTAVLDAEALTVEGKKFLGWKAMDPETGDPIDAPATMPAEELFLRAAWEVIGYNITLNMPDETTKTYKFGVEDVYDEEAPIISIESLTWTLEMEIDELDIEGLRDYYIEKLPETWELKDYTFNVAYEQRNDADVTSKLAFFNRVNTYLLQPDGTTKENKGNYWDGAENIVEIENQTDVTCGNDSVYAVKVSFDYRLLTEAQKTEATTANTSMWPTWGLQDMWVTFAIPVDKLNLNLTTVSFDAKFDNCNSDVIVYAAKKAEEGAGYVYEIGKNFTLKASEAQNLGDGWYRYTLNAVDTLAASKAADYFVFSFDNCGTGFTFDNTKPAVAYVDNVSFTENTAHEHEYTIATYDDKNHWSECACGTIDESTLAEHDITEHKEETKHWEDCTCGYKTNEGDHCDYTYVNNGETHTKTCGVCGYALPEDHAPVWVKEEKKDVMKCPCDYVTGEEFITVNEAITNIDLSKGADGVAISIFDIVGQAVFQQQNIGTCVEFILFDGNRVIAFDPTNKENFTIVNGIPALNGSCFVGGNGISDLFIKFTTKDGAEHLVKTQINVTPIYEER